MLQPGTDRPPDVDDTATPRGLKVSVATADEHAARLRELRRALSISADLAAVVIEYHGTELRAIGPWSGWNRFEPDLFIWATGERMNSDADPGVDEAQAECAGDHSLRIRVSDDDRDFVWGDAAHPLDDVVGAAEKILAMLQEYGLLEDRNDSR